jgi:hypothetical protein
MEGCVFALFLILFILYFLAACLTAGSLLGSLLLISIGALILIITAARSVITRKRPSCMVGVVGLTLITIGIVIGGITLWVTEPWNYIGSLF